MYFWQAKSVKDKIGCNIKIKEFMENNNCGLYRCSVRTGYVSRKLKNVVYKYSGKFGNGFIVAYPNYNSTNFSIVEYWIQK